MMRTPALLLVVLAAAAGFGTPVASASGDDVIRDCIAAALKPHYPAEDYRDALENMPSDVDEYSDCRAQILATQQADAAGPRASAARATLSRGAGAGTGAVVAGSAASPPAAPDASTSTVAEPVATSPHIRVNAFDAALPSEFGDFSVPAAAEPVADEKRAPLVPIVIAFAVIVATGARVLARWGNRADAGDTSTP